MEQLDASRMEPSGSAATSSPGMALQRRTQHCALASHQREIDRLCKDLQGCEHISVPGAAIRDCLQNLRDGRLIFKDSSSQML